ncbi:glycosyltransferase [Williamsia deligens]|uniref:Glycosyltransferase n=1 Tax=Williamsia deligens TaxID=321325 RepID=A0ABW3GAM6_9NOCA|nr:glycosyltransferase [Williamsia deligens]MCP2193265.1 Glycosyl transferase family 2 [Williamsia deligens]
MTSDQSPVAVIVAAFNEEKYILDTLRAIDAQRFDTVLARRVFDGFRVIVVDNNSTDRTAEIVRAHIASGPRFPVELISETEKGCGFAVDTATRYAIATGAKFIARTDADSLPEPAWLSEILRPLYDGKRLVGGRLRAREDEGAVNVVFNIIGNGWRLGHLLEWYKTRKEPDAHRRSFAICGPNMAFDADIYERSGGFPRASMDDTDEDLVFHRRVRALIGADGIALAQKAVVRISLRRLHEVGLRDFVAWYGEKERDTTGKKVDIR